MPDWSPDSERAPDDDLREGDATPVARVGTVHPVRLRVIATDDERGGAGSVVFRTIGVFDGETPDGSVPDDAPILAQGSLPSAMFNALQTSAVFAAPVPLLLAVKNEANGGLAGILFALVPQPLLERLERASRAGDEPWLSSLDSTPEYESAPDFESAGEVTRVPFALGAIVRFAEDRRHPDNLNNEAIDLLASLLTGSAMDADQKRIDLLLRSL